MARSGEGASAGGLGAPASPTVLEHLYPATSILHDPDPTGSCVIAAAWSRRSCEGIGPAAPERRAEPMPSCRDASKGQRHFTTIKRRLWSSHTPMPSNSRDTATTAQV